MQTFFLELNKTRNVSLTAYIQDVGGEFGTEFKARPAVIVLPGGGYSMCSDREADPVALAFSNAGFQTFILRYTLKNKGGWPLPLSDYEDAVNCINKRADEWHVDISRIAVAGFSAGGHLAACAATMSKHRPAAIILGYPAILRDILDVCQPNLPNPIEHIDELTPPCFLFATRDDNVVPIKNSLAFMNALEAHGIYFESHIYSYGMHGSSTGDKCINNNADCCKHISDWVKDSIDFLSNVWGEMLPTGFTDSKIKRTINGNYEDYLSIDCTYEYIVRQHAADSVLSTFYKTVDSFKATASPTMVGVIANFKIRDLLSFFNMNSMSEELNTALQKIKNSR